MSCLEAVYCLRLVPIIGISPSLSSRKLSQANPVAFLTYLMKAKRLTAAY